MNISDVSLRKDKVLLTVASAERLVFILLECAVDPVIHQEFYLLVDIFCLFVVCYLGVRGSGTYHSMEWLST